MFLRRMSLVLAVTALGCSDDPSIPDTPDTTMTTEGYDKRCAASADCILVFIGNVCGCGCTQEAIAATEGSRYATAQEEKRKACTDILNCQPCPETQTVACMQGMCSAVPK